MRTIETTRLVLEPQVAAHADEMFVVLGDPAIYEHENQPPESIDWLRTRYAMLESRRSGDGQEQWLNWVIRLRGSGLIGYVQATVESGGLCYIAYEMSSAHWGRGMAREAVESMMSELVERHQVRSFGAVLKHTNQRSSRLLERLGFSVASVAEHAECGVEADETLMWRTARAAP